MSCLHPITIRYDDVVTKCKRTVDVPCGKCVECLRKLQNDWYLRMTWELKRHSQAVFFTLTYNDANVPYSDCGYRTCCKKDVQNWLKLGRELYFKKYGSRLDIKYFICSEYGPRTFRPHYHGIFFGMDLNVFKLFFGNVWRKKYGFVTESLLWQKSQGACRYLSKYCNKGKIFECPYVAEEYVEKPFRLVSKGMGSNYVDVMKSYHLSKDIKDVKERVSRSVLRSRLFLDKFGYSLPRYYRAKIFGDSQENVSQTRFRRSMSAYVQSKVFADDLRKLRALEQRGFSESDIDSILRQEQRAKIHKGVVAYDNFVKFYDKSKL